MPDIDALFLLSGGVRRDPAVEAWFTAGVDPGRMAVQRWFKLMHGCGDDVTELLHDGCPTACVDGAAFGYVNAFTAHAAIGFFHGAALPDPVGLLEGNGKRMRHVKLRPDGAIDEEALAALINAAYADIRSRLS